jgi:pyruvate-ferredoxin/flavodoxin oxidoreductase
VLVALAEDAASDNPHFAAMPKVIGGRYGLGSKEFTPAMVAAVLLPAVKPCPGAASRSASTTTSPICRCPSTRPSAPMPRANFAAVFYGLGSDGTVSANKNSIKIIGDETELYAQGYFVYDSKKSGAMTVSHLRFGPQPIRSAYLTGEGDAGFIACHQPLSSKRTTCWPTPRRRGLPAQHRPRRARFGHRLPPGSSSR